MGRKHMPRLLSGILFLIGLGFWAPIMLPFTVFQGVKGVIQQPRRAVLEVTYLPEARVLCVSNMLYFGP